jgi:integrase
MPPAELKPGGIRETFQSSFWHLYRLFRRANLPRLDPARTVLPHEGEEFSKSFPWSASRDLRNCCRVRNLAIRNFGQFLVAAVIMATVQPDFQQSTDKVAARPPMVVATLSGQHSHKTVLGVDVHIWRRGNTYLARGSFEGRRFGETLGNDELEASARLRRLLGEIESGAYVRPSEACKRPLSRPTVSRLTLRQLLDAFLAEKRKTRGENTSATYKSRLLPVLDFVELPANRKQWFLARDIDRSFAIGLKSFLHKCQTTRNGRTRGKQKLLSTRQIINILECLQTALAWARRADIRHLPANWLSPFTPDLIGSPPTKDPLRHDLAPIAARLALVRSMDRWQLCHLALSLVLPLRPNEAVGLLVSEVDFENGSLKIGTRLAGADFTKASQSFTLPFPNDLHPVLRTCVGQRGEGPLLRSRRAFANDEFSSVASFEVLSWQFEEWLLTLPPDRIQTDQDRKKAFREFLGRIGGLSTNSLSKEFSKVWAMADLQTSATLYAMRHSVTKGLKEANIPHLDMLYLTGHSTGNILNVYTPVDPVGAMAKYFSTIRPLLAAIGTRWPEVSQAPGSHEAS